MCRYNIPILYIEWMENCESHEVGPFWSISPNGSGAMLGQSWVSYVVQPKGDPWNEKVIYIPTRYHYIIAKNDISYDDGTRSMAFLG